MGDFDCCVNGEHANECDWCLRTNVPLTLAGSCGERLCATCMPTHRELWSEPESWFLPSREIGI